MDQLTIRPKASPTLIMALAVGGLLALIITAYFSYSSGIEKGYGGQKSDKALVIQLNEAVKKSEGELTLIQEQLVFAQRQLQIQEEAYKELSKAYSNSEQKNSVLGSRLDFYRSIISPEDGQTGPAIQSFDYALVDKQLNFDITLVQAIKHKKQVRGTLRVTLYDGDKVLQKWPVSTARSVNYQYFQQISGFIELVELTSDTKVKVELTLSGAKNLEKWFPLARVANK